MENEQDIVQNIGVKFYNDLTKNVIIMAKKAIGLDLAALKNILWMLRNLRSFKPACAM